jgi:hypothetical protein
MTNTLQAIILERELHTFIKLRTPKKTLNSEQSGVQSQKPMEIMD